MPWRPLKIAVKRTIYTYTFGSKIDKLRQKKRNRETTEALEIIKKSVMTGLRIYEDRSCLKQNNQS